MTAIIIPENPFTGTNNRHSFADLTDDDAQMRKVVNGFGRLLARSYQEDKLKYGVEFIRRMMTENEKKRRANILAKWFRYLRGDCQFSIDRALDECGHALRAELDNKKYDPPPKRRLWTPE
jgi:hypothetical protein